jgi:hypothetical protein
MATPMAKKIYLAEVDVATPPEATFLPSWARSEFVEESSAVCCGDGPNAHRYTFPVLTRKGQSCT